MSTLVSNRFDDPGYFSVHFADNQNPLSFSRVLFFEEHEVEDSIPSDELSAQFGFDRLLRRMQAKACDLVRGRASSFGQVTKLAPHGLCGFRVGSGCDECRGDRQPCTRSRQLLAACFAFANLALYRRRTLRRILAGSRSFDGPFPFYPKYFVYKFCLTKRLRSNGTYTRN
jgi:hypothetical protein